MKEDIRYQLIQIKDRQASTIAAIRTDIQWLADRIQELDHIVQLAVRVADSEGWGLYDHSHDCKGADCHICHLVNHIAGYRKEKMNVS